MQFFNMAAPILRALFSDGSVSESLPESSIISFDMQMLIDTAFRLLNVVILIIILAIVLYKPVVKFMDKRRQKIQDDMDEAEKIKAEAQELKELYGKKLEEIDKERKVALQNANKRALERSEHIIREAREEADIFKRQAMAEMEEERISMQDEVKRQLIELSVMVAERFVEVSIDEKTQEKYIEEAISSWEEGLWLD